MKSGFPLLCAITPPTTEVGGPAASWWRCQAPLGPDSRSSAGPWLPRVCTGAPRPAAPLEAGAHPETPRLLRAALSRAREGRAAPACGPAMSRGDREGSPPAAGRAEVQVTLIVSFLRITPGVSTPAGRTHRPGVGLGVVFSVKGVKLEGAKSVLQPCWSCGGGGDPRGRDPRGPGREAEEAGPPGGGGGGGAQGAGLPASLLGVGGERRLSNVIRREATLLPPLPRVVTKTPNLLLID